MCVARCHHLQGDRNEIQRQAVRIALEGLLELAGETEKTE
jgi:nicotinamide mononucleotide (NMN) deamidase PncC